MINSEELMTKGMKCLKDNHGVIDAAEFNVNAVEYNKEHSFKGNAQRL